MQAFPHNGSPETYDASLFEASLVLTLTLTLTLTRALTLALTLTLTG